MRDSRLALEHEPILAHGTLSRVRRGRVAATVALALFVGNVVAIVWLWYDGPPDGNLTGIDDFAELVTSLARLTGLLGAYLALVQVLLLARIPWLDRSEERRVGKECRVRWSLYP